MSRKSEKPSVASVIAAEGNLCRYCDQPVVDDPVITYSYWQGAPFICHRQCKDAGVKQEAFDCQCIDADCNDCKHYRRGRLAPLQRTKVKTTDGRTVELTFQPEVFIDGHCLKFDKPTLACPMKWTGHPCFEHRRS